MFFKINFVTPSFQISSDIEKIRDGISEKVSHFLYYTVGFVTTFVVSMIYGWKLTLAVSVYLPIVIVVNIIIAKVRRVFIFNSADTTCMGRFSLKNLSSEFLLPTTGVFPLNPFRLPHMLVFINKFLNNGCYLFSRSR